MFNRPPPPYPGQGLIRGPVRYPGPFPGDQRVCFPSEGQMLRAPHPGDPNLRQQGPRFVLRFFVIPLCFKCFVLHNCILQNKVYHCLCVFFFSIPL